MQEIFPKKKSRKNSRRKSKKILQEYPGDMDDYNPNVIIEGTSSRFPEGISECAPGEISDVAPKSNRESSWKNQDLNLQSERTPGVIPALTSGRIHKETSRGIPLGYPEEILEGTLLG